MTHELNTSVSLAGTDYDVTVTFLVEGCHVPATRWEPSESPDVVIEACIDLATGHDIASLLNADSKALGRLEELCLQRAQDAEEIRHERDRHMSQW